MTPAQFKVPADPLAFWSGLILRLALVLAALAFLPLLAIATLFPGVDPLIAVLLLYTLGPLAVLAFAAAFILYLARAVRHLRRRSSGSAPGPSP